MASEAPLRLRDPAPGDLGWIVHRHGALYAAEYGWNDAFEGLVAQVAADFLACHDPAREKCWIAERDGQILGSIMLVAAPEPGVAKLRLLLVEPEARGLGLGKRLVSACLAFAREAGYRRVTLWTNDVLSAARGIYVQAGFQLVATEPHARFGKPMTGETWELELPVAGPPLLVEAPPAGC